MQNKGTTNLRTANSIAKLNQPVLWGNEVYTIHAIHLKTQYLELKLRQQVKTENILVPALEVYSLDGIQEELPTDLNGYRIQKRDFIIKDAEPQNLWRPVAWNESRNELLLVQHNGKDTEYCDPLYLRVADYLEDCNGQILKTGDQVEFNGDDYEVVEIDIEAKILLMENDYQSRWINPGCLIRISQ